MFSDDEIARSFQEEIEEKERMIIDKDYPHEQYDYSTDDSNDYEYQQDCWE